MFALYIFYATSVFVGCTCAVVMLYPEVRYTNYILMLEFMILWQDR